jgi:putrescine transport system substrate-binding protein
VALQEAIYTGYATPNRSAFDALPPSVRSDPETYPAESVRLRLERGLPLDRDGAELRSKIWSEIRHGDI